MDYLDIETLHGIQCTPISGEFTIDADIEHIIKKYTDIRDRGFIESTQSKKNNGAIGYMYEHCLGIKANNSKKPDLFNYEIKSQRKHSTTYVTLFNKSATFPENGNSILREQCGITEIESGQSILNVSLKVGHITTHRSGTNFTLKVDTATEKIYIVIFDMDNNVIRDDIGWNFSDLKPWYELKLKNLFHVIAECKEENDKEYFHYNKAYAHKDIVSFDEFIQLIIDGTIMFDIRLGVYRSGKHIGKTHDHGTALRIRDENMKLLYKQILEIK